MELGLMSAFSIHAESLLSGLNIKMCDRVHNEN